jgi:hypothetical protein
VASSAAGTCTPNRPYAAAWQAAAHCQERAGWAWCCPPEGSTCCPQKLPRISVRFSSAGRRAVEVSFVQLVLQAHNQQSWGKVQCLPFNVHLGSRLLQLCPACFLSASQDTGDVSMLRMQRRFKPGGEVDRSDSLLHCNTWVLAKRKSWSSCKESRQHHKARQGSPAKQKEVGGTIIKGGGSGAPVTGCPPEELAA